MRLLNRITVIVFLLLSSSLLFARKKAVPIPLSAAKESKCEILSENAEGFLLKLSFSRLVLHPAELYNQKFWQIEAKNLSKTYDAGKPEIPVFSRVIEIPCEAEVEVAAIAYDEELVELNRIFPVQKIVPAQNSVSKENASRPIPPDRQAYHIEAFNNSAIASFTPLGQMRSASLGRLEICPIVYHPEKNLLKIYNNLIIRVKYKDSNRNKTRNLKRKYASPYFSEIYPKIGYKNTFKSKSLITQSPVHMVIVSDRMFEEQLRPFMAWKIKKGFQITTLYTDSVGTNKDSIKHRLQDIYEGANPMTFVLFVGDVEQIPAWKGKTGDHVTDLYYCEYTNDYYPDVFYGRFSAQTPQQLQAQIDKTLHYEQYALSEPSYLSENLIVAGDDPDFEETHLNGTVRYATKYYLNPKHAIRTHAFYQTPQINNRATEDSIIKYMNAGIGFVNYTAHCSPSGWTLPEIDKADITNLQKNGKYGLWIGNCCRSLRFSEAESFGELALRKENGGAVGYIGASNYTYWDEDYWWAVGYGTPVNDPDYSKFEAGAYDGLFHTQTHEADNPNRWYTTQGQISFAGNAAVENSTSPNKQYYWEIYHLMGDPSVQNYLREPLPMPVYCTPEAIRVGMNYITIHSAPYTYAALSQNGKLIAAALSDASGKVTLHFHKDSVQLGKADLVVTGQNRKPHIGKIDIIAANTPYTILHQISADQPVEYGKEINLSIQLKNVAEGVLHACNIKAALKTDSKYVTLIDSVENYDTIRAQEITPERKSFQIKVASDVPDKTSLKFQILISEKDFAGNQYLRTALFSLEAQAPDLHVGDLIIKQDDNNNGVADPGEHVKIAVPLVNQGHAGAQVFASLLEQSSPKYLTILPLQNFPVDLNASGSVYPEFECFIDSQAPLYQLIQLRLTANAQQTNLKTLRDYNLLVGKKPELSMIDTLIKTCKLHFFDSGGKTNNYSNGEMHTVVFMSRTPSHNIQASINQLDIEEDCDFLEVHDGASAAAPLLAKYTGALSDTVIIRADNPEGALTFVFTSDGENTATGWEIDISCFDPGKPPLCPEIYSPKNNESVPQNQVHLTWQDVNAQEYALYLGETLPDTPLVVLQEPFYSPENLQVGTELKWRVESRNAHGVATACGLNSFTVLPAKYFMQSGKFAVCEANFLDKGGADNNYPNIQTDTMTFFPQDSGAVLSVHFTYFATEPTHDYLAIYNGENTDAECLGKLSGKYPEGIPLDLRNLKADNEKGALTFVFVSDSVFTKSGWEATLSCKEKTSTALVKRSPDEVRLFPNPNHGNFKLLFPDRLSRKIFLYNLSGQIIFETETQEQSLAIGARAIRTPGLYIIKIITVGQPPQYLKVTIY
ncbi:MAG: hypothetical protein CSB06_01895 [Bacteroidia bacterium]|nr:MAG: hypothetical protein CSB06_01895 [Bacteroidia bacterium]